MYNQNYRTPNTRTPQSGLIPVGFLNPNMPSIFNPNMPHIFNPYITPDNRYKEPSSNNILFNTSQPNNNLLDKKNSIQNNKINESELIISSNYVNVFDDKLNKTPTIIEVSEKEDHSKKDSKKKNDCIEDLKKKNDCKEDSKNKDDSKEDSKNKDSSKKYFVLLEDEVFSKKNILKFISNLPETIKKNINIINLNKDINNGDYMNKFKDIRVDIFRIVLNSFIQLKDSIKNHNDDLHDIFDFMLDVDYYTETKIDFEKIFKEVKSDDEVLELNLKMEEYNYYMKNIVKKKWITKKQLKCFLRIPEKASSPDKRKRKASSLNNKFENSKSNDMDSKSDEGKKPKRLTLRKKTSDNNTKKNDIFSSSSVKDFKEILNKKITEKINPLREELEELKDRNNILKKQIDKLKEENNKLKKENDNYTKEYNQYIIDLIDEV